MSINGTFYGATANAWIKPRIQWQAQANTEGNYSDVTATLSYTRTNTGYTTSGHWAGWLRIGESISQVSGVYVQITNGGYTATISHTARIPHKEDGTCQITIAAGGGIDGTSLEYTVISAQVTLEDIPRAASVSATDADIGGICCISIGRKSTLYTHTLAYEFQSLQGYLSETALSDTPVHMTADTVSFPLPESFYYAMPLAASAPCTLTCTTYLGAEVVGTPQQTTFTVRAAYDACAPVLSFQAADRNPLTLALTGDPACFVKGVSSVLCQMDASGQFGAQILQTQLNGAAVDTPVLLEGIDTGTLVCAVRDSRGHVTQATHTYPLIGYFSPSGILQAARTDATSGEADILVQGSWFSGSFGAQNNGLEVRCRVDSGDWEVLEAVTDADTYTVSARLAGLAYTQSHTVTVEVIDCIGTLTLSAHVNPGIPVFDWGDSDFRFHVPVQAPRLTGLAAPQDGTDAANKDYVDTADDAIRALAESKLSMTLLWENASPTSSFASQTISMALSGYDAIMVMAFSKTTIQDIGIGLSVLGYRGLVQFPRLYNDGYTGVVMGGREFTPAETGVTFGSGVWRYSNVAMSGSNFDNTHMIPYRIYGIKGVTA